MRKLWVIVLLAGAVLVAPATATFPGPSGSISYSIGRVLPDGYFDFDICSTAAEGRPSTRVTSSMANADLSPSSSADGTRLALSRNPVGSEKDVGLVLVRADGKGLTDLRTQGIDPAWSPDGRSLVFSAAYLYVLDIATGRRTLLFTPTGPLAQTSDADWAPDGRAIAFTYNRADSPSAVYTIAPDSSSLTRVAEGSGPSWSPDGSRLAFSDRHGDIHTVRPDGSDLRVVTEDPAMDLDPSWSPDATQIAFVRVSERRNRYSRSLGAETDIYVVSAEGGIPRNVTRSPFDELDPSWARRPASAPSVGRPPCTMRGSSRPDRLRGSPGPDVAYAGAGSDVLSGRQGNDLLDGESGPDLVSGGPDDDVLAGGPGADRLDGASGRDSIFGGRGPDRIDARDRDRDQIDCGRGRDRVIADARDRVKRNCERLIRDEP